MSTLKFDSSHLEKLIINFKNLTVNAIEQDCSELKVLNLLAFLTTIDAKYKALLYDLKMIFYVLKIKIKPEIIFLIFFLKYNFKL
jgi:hypothetical protein